MKTYETLISFTYEAETPQDAVKQFMTNIPLANWDVSVKDIETGETFTIDTAIEKSL